ncbi:MAG: hypothetical protein ACK5Q5_22045 [Planctomycetaceae bacterium]
MGRSTAAALPAAAALGLGLATAGSLLAQSGAGSRSSTLPGTYRTAQYEVSQSDAASVWSEYRVGWTALDEQGRTVRTAPTAINVTPPRPAPTQPQSMRAYEPARPYDVAATQPPHREYQDGYQSYPVSQQRAVPLPAAIIQRGLQAGTTSAPATAADFLRHRTADPPMPTTAGGIARRTGPGTPLNGSPTSMVRPFPIEPIDYVPHQEERAYRLFEVPGESSATSSSGRELAALWERAQLTAGGVAPVSGKEIQPTPVDAAGTHVGRVMLDGLDAVSTGATEQPPGYQPTPLAAIRPCREYSPGGVETANGQPLRHPDVVRLPENWDMVERSFPHLDYMWMPSNVFYNPLYFEDPALERYGHSHGPLLQPIASVSRFGVQLIGLPYQMALDPPHRRVYPLGFFRPGDCAPAQVPNIPLNAEAAAKAGAVYTGLIFAFP